MPYIDYTYHKAVSHIGFLDTPEARRPSLDGPGISVTTRPDSWRTIRGLNGPELTLVFSAGQWVDAMTFGDEDLVDMRNWAVSNRYIRPVTAWFSLVEVGGTSMSFSSQVCRYKTMALSRKYAASHFHRAVFWFGEPPGEDVG